MSSKLKLLIDLNLDAGESAEKLRDGSEEAIYQFVTSVNVACGGHAGDEATMAQAVELALKYNLNLGAHPSFPDRAGFGRVNMKLTYAVLVEALTKQMESLKAVCSRYGVKLSHVKPHGALYNLVAHDIVTSQAMIESIQKAGLDLAVIGLAGSSFLNQCANVGLKPVPEAFADRRYESDGSLRSRKFPDALIEDPLEAAEQALAIVRDQGVNAVDGSKVDVKAKTICIHSDSPNSLEIAKAVCEALRLP